MRPEDDVKAEDIKWRQYIMALGKVEVDPGQDGLLAVEMTNEARMERFIFDDGDSDFEVVRISVAGVDLSASHLIGTPLSVFRMMTAGILMGGRPVTPGQKIELVVRNVSDSRSKLRAALLITITKGTV